MWTAATTAHFLPITPLFLQRRKCRRADSSSSDVFRFVPDLFWRYGSFQGNRPWFPTRHFHHNARGKQQHVETVLWREQLLSYLLCLSLQFKTPLGTLQCVLRLPIVTPNERSPLRMFPTTCQLEGEALRSPCVRAGISCQPAAAERAPWRARQAEPTGGPPNETAGLLHSGTTRLGRTT